MDTNLNIEEIVKQVLAGMSGQAATFEKPPRGAAKPDARPCRRASDGRRRPNGSYVALSSIRRPIQTARESAP